MNPALVILAAGASRRLGQCKALVPLAFGTPLSLLARAGACLEPNRPLVVTGAHDGLIRERAPQGVDVCYNPDWRRGKLTSVVLAARERPRQDLILAPVDVPLVPREVFEALLRAWNEAGSPARGWLAPRYAPPEGVPRRARSGAFGHPVLAGRELLGEFGELAPEASLRDLRALADPLLAVGVDRPEILDDLDTPEDLERLRALIRS